VSRNRVPAAYHSA